MTRQEYNKIYNAWYAISRRGKAARKRYRQSAKGKATARRVHVKYAASAKGHATLARAQARRRMRVLKGARCK